MASVAVFAHPAKKRSVSVILHSLRVPVPMADDNVNRPACELSDVLENDDLSNSSQSTPSFYSLVKPYLLLSQVAKSMSA